MRVAEMRGREDYDRVLAETLSAGWSEEFGRSVQVRSGEGESGQAWRFSPTLSAYFVAHARPRVRRFLRESLQFTPVPWRIPAQWLVSQLLASAPGLRLASRPAFAVDPGLADAEERLVVPGNRRIRVFDFGRRRTRVFLKQGFPEAAIQSEVATRGGGIPGPFQPILLAGATWFEEEIFDGVALPRCPPWFDRAVLGRAALTKLDGWLDRTTRQVVARDHVELVAARCVEGVAGAGLPPEVRAPLAGAVLRLSRVACELGEVSVALGHGDMQPGNVLVPRAGLDVCLIDWEYSAERWREYDRFTWVLQARYGPGLSARLGAYVRGQPIPGLEAAARDAGARRNRAALFLLEDLAWLVADARTSPFTNLSAGFRARLQELEQLVRLTEGQA